MSKDVFQRKEVKYLLTLEQYETIRQGLVGHMQPDMYGRSLIQSVYLDTPDRSIAVRYDGKQVYKEKLRVRRYIPANSNVVPAADCDAVFVELKKKFKGITYKRRVHVNEGVAGALMLADKSYLDALDAFMPARSVLSEPARTAKSVQIASELVATRDRYEGLCPSMLINAVRVAWEPVGTSDANIHSDETAGIGDVRITFDESIEYADLQHISREAAAQDFGSCFEAPSHRLLEDGLVLMEVKVPGAYPMWLSELLSFAKAVKSSYTKYGNAVRAHLSGTEAAA